ncbi:hypothetical protein [Streptomyces djakartensis]|uniref:tryptophan--tRNA ligase n=1 Tax=Streptomyces djakartensis TaxID=68193 RepID=A0ABQ2ZJS4_9ACTN|nr:hypothetical protein [Streptomyces djakartensis]GGY15969.1 tryptophan--tRNA ligase [Streptomyces djakartensis]
MSLLMTGARPTGGLHIGQYLAAFKPFVQRQREFDQAVFIVSDLHMLTTGFSPERTKYLAAATRRLVAEAVGFGVDPDVSTFYLQSSVGWHARIYAVLQSLADISRLEQHGSFAEMARHSADARPPSLGLLGYPVLESSDVLSIGPTHVCIGESNVSHFEHLAEIVELLHDGWGVNFTVPEMITGRKNLVGLDGSNKMSKSLGNAVFFADGPDALVRKVHGMSVRSTDGKIVAVEYLEALEAPADLCRELEEDIENAGRVTERAAKELADRLIAFIQPVDRAARELLASGAVDDLLQRGRDLAEDRGARAYHELAAKVGLLRLS